MFLAEHFILGPLAQLARVLPWHGRGQGFKSLMVHNKKTFKSLFYYFFLLLCSLRNIKVV